MAYVALKRQPGPGGVVRQPGDHMPEADAWRNPKLWVDTGHVLWVPNADIQDGRWKDFREFAMSGAGGLALKRLALADVGKLNGTPAPIPTKPAAPEPAPVAPPPPTQSEETEAPTPMLAPTHVEEARHPTREELEAMSAAELLGLARKLGHEVKEGTGKGKLVRMLAPAK